MNTKSSLYETIIRIIIFLAIIGCALFILSPFVYIILWALILGISLRPTHLFISKKLGNRLKLGSAITVTGILIILIIPIFLLTSSLIAEVNQARVNYSNGTMQIPVANEQIKKIPIIGEKVYEAWKMAITNQDTFIEKYHEELTLIGSTVGNYGYSVIGSFVEILIALILAGFLLASKGAEEAIRLFFLKLAGEKGDELVQLIIKTVSTVAKGIIGEGLVLGLLHGIVFMLAGVPYAALWALLVFIFAITQLPIFSVTIPVCIYFFFVYGTVPAILWTVAVVITTMSDNVLTPIMLGKGSPIPMAVMFIGVLGGFAIFGFIGLFTGPVIFALAYNLLISWMYPTTENTHANSSLNI